MADKSNFSIKQILSVLTGVMPIAFSMAVCAGMGAFAGAVFACIAALICSIVEEKKQMPAYAVFLIITFAFKEFGAATASLSVVICGVLLAFSGLFYNKAKEKLDKLTNNPITGAVMLLTALTITVLFTTDYFGIGATGNTVKEIIKSYLSLGFHPNWRGVLYGTIVMVVMITFPRKFKKASKTVNAAFIALVLTTALNFWLNPSDMISAIREAGELSFNEYKNSILLPLFNTTPAFYYSFFCGISLYLTCFYMHLQNENGQKSDLIISGITSCVSGFMTCMVIPAATKKKNLLNGFVASLLTGFIFFVFHNFIARIPVHSCAVVLIVGVWQSVKWSEVKKIFSSLLNTALFVLIAIPCLILGFIFTPVTAFIALEMYSRIAPKANK